MTNCQSAGEYTQFLSSGATLANSLHVLRIQDLRPNRTGFFQADRKLLEHHARKLLTKLMIAVNDRII